MNVTKGRSNRIDACRNMVTGEVGSAHLVGTTVGGHDLYQFVEGWEPVCRQVDDEGDETYVPTTRLQSDRDGNWYVR